MVYQWKSASHITVDAQAAGELFEELEKTVGLTPKSVLDASREESAPLHEAFEWDDSVAAESYREFQATHLINCICIKKDTDPNVKEPVRAWFKFEKSSPYESTTLIMSNVEKREKLLNTAKLELLAFKRKYTSLSELEDVFKAIDNFAS